MKFESLFISEDKPYIGKSRRDKYLSRVFGIFNEEIICIWCNNPRSHFTDLGRPTIYSKEGKHYTLDFLFKDTDGNHFVGEMKCEIEYQHYKYLTLETSSQLDHHKKYSKAFQLFLEVAKNPGSHTIKTNGNEISVQGTTLVWGRTTRDGETEVKNEHSISHVFSTENIVADLISWNDNEYFNLISDYRCWSNELFDGLTRE